MWRLRVRVKFHGVSGSTVKQIAREFFQQMQNEPKKDKFAHCEALLETDYSEESFIAFAWAYKRKATMPRTALRYAIEKMPEDMRMMATARE